MSAQRPLNQALARAAATWYERAGERARPAGREGMIMRAVKARFDGERIALPEEAKGQPPGEVIIVFGEADDADDADDADKALWLAAAEVSLAKVWDNEDDAIYDKL